MAQGSRKKPLDFDGNPDHVVLMVRVMVRWGRHRTLRGRTCITRHLLNSNNFATSVALAEVCTILSAILITIFFKLFIAEHM